MWPVRNRTPLPAPASRVEILKSVYDHHTFDVFPRVFRKLRKFARHPADLTDHSTDYLLPFLFAPVRKRQMQIEHRGPPQRRAHRVRSRRKARADKSRDGSRQKSQQFHAGPSDGILQPFPHSGPLCKRPESGSQRLRRRRCARVLVRAFLREAASRFSEQVCRRQC